MVNLTIGPVKDYVTQDLRERLHGTTRPIQLASSTQRRDQIQPPSLIKYGMHCHHQDMSLHKVLDLIYRVIAESTYRYQQFFASSVNLKQACKNHGLSISAPPS